MLNKIAYYTKRFLYGVLRRMPCNPFTPKRVLIVKLDAIGDYILFRNSLSAIKYSERFRSYSFFLLGNRACKDLAESFDKNIVDVFIWVDPQTVYSIDHFSWPAFKLLFSLKLKGFDIVIQPTHSRLISTDVFIKHIGAKRSIASMGDNINFPSAKTLPTNSIYTELIPVPPHDTFEFLRNVAFAHNLTGDNNIHIPLFLAEKANTEQNSPLKIVLFPGAGHAFRRWPAKNFAILIERITQWNKNVVFTIAGGPSDTGLATEIINAAHGYISLISDLTGKTSLTGMVHLLQHSDLLISNETSAVHMGAAVDLNTVCISNGNQFGRFNPYPLVLQKSVETVYPDERFSDPQKFEQLIESTKVRSDLDIQTITVDKVFDVVCKFIPERRSN